MKSGLDGPAAADGGPVVLIHLLVAEWFASARRV
jgi:hypothetical protein